MVPGSILGLILCFLLYFGFELIHELLRLRLREQGSHLVRQRPRHDRDVAISGVVRSDQSTLAVGLF